MKPTLTLAVGAALVALASPACAQEMASGGDATEKPETPPKKADSDTLETLTLPDKDEKIDVAAITVPSLTFTPDAKYEKDFDKYYYFHRDATDFKTALADLRDCDNLSRGLASPLGNAPVTYPNAGVLGSALGGAIGSALASAIFGSAQVRATRRINMRRCMFYKGYQRYGLPKDIWKEFNFEEGFGPINEDKRQAYLKQQAKITSGDKPSTGALGR